MRRASTRINSIVAAWGTSDVNGRLWALLAGKQYSGFAGWFADAYVDDTGLIPNFAWVHLAVTFNGTAVYVYVNGALVTGGLYSRSSYTSMDPAKPLSALNTAADFPLFIGRGSDSYGPTDYFGGAVDELMVFNRAFSAAEVNALYLSTPATPSLSPTPSGTPSAVPTSCNASTYRVYAGYDIDGYVASMQLVTTERQCREACCATPGCDAYALDAAQLFQQASAVCALKGNVTQLIPSSLTSTAVRLAAMPSL